MREELAACFRKIRRMAGYDSPTELGREIKKRRIAVSPRTLVGLEDHRTCNPQLITVVALCQFYMSQSGTLNAWQELAEVVAGSKGKRK